MAEQKTIYCPRCGRKVMTHDGKGTLPIDSGCKKCKKRVVYFPENGVVKMTKIPERESSSCNRIWF